MSDWWAFFGDGNAAEILDSKKYVDDETGIKMVKFIFRPSKMIEQQYQIREEQDVNGLIIRVYKSTDVLFLQESPSRTRCWIFTDFDEGDTPASRRFKELTEALEDTERLIRSSEAAKNRAYEELSREREQMAHSVKSMVNMVKEIAKVRGRLDDDEGSSQGFSADGPE